MSRLSRPRPLLRRRLLGAEHGYHYRGPGRSYRAEHGYHYRGPGRSYGAEHDYVYRGLGRSYIAIIAA